MSRNNLYLLGILATIVIGTLLYLNLCSECMTASVRADSAPITDTVVPSEKVQKATSYPFSLSDPDFQYASDENFNFNISSPSFLMPLSSKVKNGVTDLAKFLETAPNRSLGITGFYTNEEDNITAFPNLGLARANSVKNHFVLNGIPSSKINTYGILKEEMISEEGMFLGPVAFEIREKSEDEEDELRVLYEKIKAEPLVLYFSTGRAAINLSPEQRQKIADISRYLDKVSEARCSIVGHTDNVGNRDTNVRLGQERADFAKAYLVRNGISEDKIDTSSKGPDVPIASNTSEAGRSKNRRTVVTLN